MPLYTRMEALSSHKMKHAVPFFLFNIKRRRLLSSSRLAVVVCAAAAGLAVTTAVAAAALIIYDYYPYAAELQLLLRQDGKTIIISDDFRIAWLAVPWNNIKQPVIHDEDVLIIESFIRPAIDVKIYITPDIINNIKTKKNYAKKNILDFSSTARHQQQQQRSCTMHQLGSGYTTNMKQGIT